MNQPCFDFDMLRNLGCKKNMSQGNLYKTIDFLLNETAPR